MKIAEFRIKDYRAESSWDIGKAIKDVLYEAKTRSCRIEINSIEDQPWPRERPEGWGVGCWVDVEGNRGIVFDFYPVADWCRWVTASGVTFVCKLNHITGYGPRMGEAP